MKNITIKANGTITNNHMENLESELKSAQTRCTARTITAQEIIDTITEIEEYMRKLSTIEDMIGTTINADINAQHFPSSYGYIPESTHFNARRTKNGWKITSICRAITKAPTKRISVDFTPETKAHMADRLTYIA